MKFFLKFAKRDFRTEKIQFGYFYREKYIVYGFRAFARVIESSAKSFFFLFFLPARNPRTLDASESLSRFTKKLLLDGKDVSLL